MEIPSPELVFEELKKGSRRKYDMLVAALKKNNATPFIPDASLTTIIRGVHQHVVVLDRQNSSIALEIMKLQWQGGGEGVLEGYKALILDLVSVHTGVYLHDCLRTIVKNFKPTPGITETHTQTNTQADTQAYKHNHNLLANIAAIVPKATLDLQHLLPAMFIHYNLPKHIQTTFTTNMLHLSTYLPPLRPIIIKLTLKLLTELDARASRTDIMESLKEDEDEPKISDTAQAEMRLKRADTLDNQMCIVFEYIQKTCFYKGVLRPAETRSLYLEVMESFQTLLLTPSMTTHTQFILFYFCSLHKSIQEHFLEVLWHKLTSPSQEALYRQLASLYLAGLLSRAKFISLETIQQHLTRMRNWIEAYSANSNDSHKQQLQQQQLQRHSPFYFLCQTFFYLFVCRHKMILESPNGHSFLMSLYPQRIAFCRLNPLKHCIPSLADAFCAVVRNNQIAFCDTVLERNRRMLTSPHASTTPSLLSYSPFDSYLLQKSKDYITPLYQDYDDSAFLPDHLHCHLREDMEYLDLEDIVSFSPKHSSLFNHHMMTALNH